MFRPAIRRRNPRPGVLAIGATVLGGAASAGASDDGEPAASFSVNDHGVVTGHGLDAEPSGDGWATAVG